MGIFKKARRALECYGAKEFARISVNYISRRFFQRAIWEKKSLPPELLVEKLGIDMAPKRFRSDLKKKVVPCAFKAEVTELGQALNLLMSEVLEDIEHSELVPPHVEKGSQFDKAKVTITLDEYTNTRNCLLKVAINSPQQLVLDAIKSSFAVSKDFLSLRRTLVSCIKEMARHHDAEIIKGVLFDLHRELPAMIGSQACYRLFSHIELVLGARSKITLGIYDQAFQFAGGGQRYMAALAELLQDKYDITYITNKGGSLKNYKDWFNIDLSRCALKNIPLQFFDDRECEYIDEGMVVSESRNPFDVIAQESLKYDVFINANMLSKVEPRSLFSVFIGHFPHRGIDRFFQVQKYNFLIGNGDYSSLWLKKSWLLDPTHQLYPPVDMYNEASAVNNKKKMILSAARFDATGSKKQLELISAFNALCREYPEIAEDWQLVLAGGNFASNAYFERVKRAQQKSTANIELRPDVDYQGLKNLYKDAAIFWHACGLNETSPGLIEHFGMTTVEAMQNYCVPIVIDGGGQVEIVAHGECGFRFDSLAALQDYTMKVIMDDSLRFDLAEKAYKRSHDFNLDVFNQHVFKIFEEVEVELLGEEQT